VQNKVFIWINCDLTCELGLFDRRIDHRILVIFEDAEEAIEAYVDARRLDHRLGKWLDLDSAKLDF
jgi:hypothetical protein